MPNIHTRIVTSTATITHFVLLGLNGAAAASIASEIHGQTVHSMGTDYRPMPFGVRVGANIIPVTFQPPRINPPERLL